MTVSTEEDAFFELCFYCLPVFVCDVSDGKLLVAICMMELESSLIPLPPTMHAFSAQRVNSRSFCPEPSNFSITGAAPTSTSSLIVLKLIVT